MIPKPHALIRSAERGLTMAAVAYVLVLAVWLAVPTSTWFEPLSVRVNDAQAGSDPSMEIARLIHRSFNGRFFVTVRAADNGPVVCGDGHTLDYYPNSSLPPPPNQTLSWWAWDQRCAELPPGQYVAKTEWWIAPFPDLGLSSLLPRRRVHIVSNIFVIS